MGGLNRKASVFDISSVAQEVTQARLARAPTVKPSPDIPGIAEVAYHGCSVSLAAGASTGVTSLRILICIHGLPSRQVGKDADHLFATLERALSDGVELVVTYDFRGLPAARVLTQGLATMHSLCNGERAHLLRRAKSAAMLVKENIFFQATVGFVGSFVQVLGPGCPILVCHNEVAAEDFFRIRAGAAVPSTFVSVVGVDVTRSGEACVASLAPLEPLAGARSAHPAAAKLHAEAPSTYHMLPNGDVRVIQSPPRDIIMGKVAEELNGEDLTYSETAAKCASYGALGSGNLPALAGLLFVGSTGDSLRHLIGAHFHVGELVVDAEAESFSRRMSKSRTSAQSRCYGGITIMLQKIIQRMMDY